MDGCPSAHSAAAVTAVVVGEEAELSDRGAAWQSLLIELSSTGHEESAGAPKLRTAAAKRCSSGSPESPLRLSSHLSPLTAHPSLSRCQSSLWWAVTAPLQTSSSALAAGHPHPLHTSRHAQSSASLLRRHGFAAAASSRPHHRHIAWTRTRDGARTSQRSSSTLTARTR